MYTISNVLQDIDRGALSHNLQENMFSYRMVYFINENGRGRKYYVDTSYENLRQVLENIIRQNLSTTNNIVISAVTIRKNGRSVSLLSKSYCFSLDPYFQRISSSENKNRYGKEVFNWC